MTLVELKNKFWSKVDIKDSDDCWEYRYGKTPDGYGQFWIDGKGGVRAHRFAYESYYKCKIPFGKLILHKCDNPACCNPRHLYIGTHLDNVRDAGDRGRRNLGKIACSLAKFTAEKILAVRRLRDSRLSQKDVAKLLNINHGTVNRIWKEDKYACREGYFVRFNNFEGYQERTI